MQYKTSLSGRRRSYSCHTLRALLEKPQQPYILAVASHYTITIGFKQYKVYQLLEHLKLSAHHTIFAGEGSKSQRYYQ